MESLVSVVLPTKNEPSVGDVIKRIKNTLNCEILVVDASNDDTAEKAKKAGAKVISQRGIGYGDAYIQGFKYSTGKIIVMMDADSTYAPEEIPNLIKPILNGEADFVLGNRFSKEMKMKNSHKFGNKIITNLLNSLYKINITDSQTGFRAIKKEVLDSMHLYSPDMPLASEMIVEARKNNFRITEIPVSYNERIGKSKQNKLKVLDIISTIIRLIRDYNPLAVFGYSGLFLILAGILLGASVVQNYFVYGTLTAPGRAILASMLVLLGFFALGYGLMIDLLVKELKRK